MTQSNNNFASGFLLGSIVGSVLGGILGATLANRRNENLESEEILNGNSPNQFQNPNLDVRADAEIEAARRRLETKIAQLNETIDDVRDQLGTMNKVSSDPETNG
ncbi:MULTISPECIES: hypothetical protein [unclassified Roseofilum]|uniref:hypothetical protein n=1 Tax=unclassified Roseofilum TaxID=2620099 RepID=UPI000E8DCA02|nr:MULTISPECIES: hypothetical protein [unclassified Roseofilum]HBQ96943.1 hypothetical protein [Cyanobacteria bacterium UBA11691]MBP0008437.1 hypothetical protein [Roseofilum sp. Belize Diploria]MBP0013060.1 hypothetical protein [Roseofilum sp. SID3]MBP0023118.1 hypothetical protein [Roseofilum sp. SID2]MBP0033720.1 hypothetical protein [Roseofilum sp. Belize BBD 4]